jgi:cyclophilin family peptidyl-prolyl cis-trans isomerase/HEAT repeat protein
VPIIFRFQLIVGLALTVMSSSARQPSLRERMLLAEDARAQTAEAVAPLLEGLRSADATLRRQAVRALGRFERPELIPRVAALLNDMDTGVRMEAYNALGQVARGSAVSDVQERLLRREPTESEPTAWGVLAATLGRLPYGTAQQVSRTEAVLVRALSATDDKAASESATGALEGFEALVRQARKIATPSAATVAGLRAAATRRVAGAEDFARARRFAWLALMPLGEVDASLVELGFSDADEEVRRLAAQAAGNDGALDRRAALVEKGLADSSPRVRYEALRSWGRQLQKTSCAPLRAALRDTSPHVVLQAIDLLAADCPEGDSAAAALLAIAEVLTSRPGAWHSPSHALVSLARVAPAEARTLLPRYLEHGTWQVRMYAARAAGTLGALDALDKLARDPEDNVREAALGQLMALKRPEAGRLALDALARRDYQLVLTAARALGPPPLFALELSATEVAKPLLQALDRITAEQRETSRDPRLALLDRLKELGGPDGNAAGPELVSATKARLSDFDPAIARKAAEILQTWTRRPHTSVPQPLQGPPVSLAAVEVLRGVRLRWTMAGKGAFTMRLLVEEAPVSALRVATRAREGYYDGLTFHRVVPNFVIQGGSPGANEYMGDGPFMRDEVGLLSHRRGTVGISTRGRDTGDAQIFVNLVDLPRLDHTYTVFAEVIEGMDVVDAILEGDVIERVEVVK